MPRGMAVAHQVAVSQDGSACKLRTGFCFTHLAAGGAAHECMTQLVTCSSACSRTVKGITPGCRVANGPSPRIAVDVQLGAGVLTDLLHTLNLVLHSTLLSPPLRVGCHDTLDAWPGL